MVQVRVEGNHTVTLAKILTKIRTRAGRPYLEEQVQQDVRDLYKLGTFAAVRTFKQPVQGGVIVTFQVAERPLLREVIIVGNDKYLTSVLKKEAELKVGDAADPFAVENGRRKILDYYQKKGYSKARVTILEGDKAGDLRAIFVVDEGPQQSVFWVNFEGNHFASSARLKTLIDSHPPWFYLFAGELDRKQIDEDVAKLTAYYRSWGFFHAVVSRELIPNEKQDWITINFVINEGPRYAVRNVSFLGNKKINNPVLAEKLKLLSGQFFDQNQQNLDLQKLRDEYGGHGYVFAKIEADNRFLEEPGKLDIVYNVEEGSRYRVGRINIEIKGENPHTQITTVLNRLSFKPGDIVDTREFRNSERRLKAAQLYKVEPQKNIEPKIVYNPPESDDKDTATAGQRRTTYYRVPGGEAPLPPDEGYLDVDLSVEPQASETASPENTYYPPAGYRPAAYMRPVFQGQTFKSSACATEVFTGQAYPLPPQGPQTFVRFVPPPQAAVYVNQAQQAPAYSGPVVQPVSRPAVMQAFYPGDGWSQPSQGQSWPAASNNYGTDAGHWSQPPQGQSWPAASDNNASYAGQAPQNYVAPQPQAGGVTYYNPPPAASAAPYAAPYAAPAAPPSANAPNPAYNVAPNYGAPAANPANLYPSSPPPSAANPANPYPSSPPPSAAGVMGGSGYDTQGGYTASGPAPSRPVAQLAAGGDIFNNPEATMVPTPDTDPLRNLTLFIGPEETQTGRLMFGVGVNSDAGLVGNITLDEQNFDWTKVPTSWEDIMEGKAFRGAGERFRLELVPGTQVQRYMISFENPYFMDRPVSFGTSGFFYQRIYPEWTESRAGGSVSFGYQFTHDLTGSIRFQGQDVNIKNPAYPVPDLEECVGRNQLYTTSLSLSHNTRDNPFMATEGHLLSATLEETVGSFQYARASVEFSQFFRIFERADRSGKHVLSFTLKAGYSGDDTPIFERYYDGGFSTIRGFAFRGVTPRDPVYNMGVGGDFQMLASTQYLFPITADDMLKGVVFMDAGTVEPRITDWVDKVRVAPGFGLRISIPMMGPAPIALDFAFPIVQQSGDQTQIFSFFVGFNH